MATVTVYKDGVAQASVSVAFSTGTQRQVSTAAELAAADADATLDGQTIIVRGGDYGAVTLAANRTAQTSFQVAAGEQARFTGLTFTGRNIRFAGATVNGLAWFRGSSSCEFDAGMAERLGFGMSYSGGRDSRVKRSRIHYPIQPTPEQVDLVRVGSGGHDGILIEDTLFDYHDDANHYHSDVVQTYSGVNGDVKNVTLRRCYSRRLNCQNFFFKDVVTVDILVEDSLIVDALAPWHLNHFFQVDGLTVRRCTHWSDQTTGISIRQTENRRITMDGNVERRAYFENAASVEANMLLRRRNVISSDTAPCGTPAPTDVVGVDPAADIFVDRSTNDWRLKPGAPNYGYAGITWRPADKTYGPAAVGAV